MSTLRRFAFGLALAALAALAAAPPPAPAAAPAAPPAPPPGRSFSAAGPLAILLLLGVLAIAVAAFVFFLRTRPTTAPPAPTAVLPATATLPLGGVDPAAATATAAAASPIAPTPPAATPTPVGGPLPAPPSATPPPPPTLAPTPTPVAPSPTSDSPVTALTLIDPANDRAIRALRVDDSIDLSEIGRDHLNVRADFEDAAIESVLFLLDGAAFCPRGNCVENAAPYYMGGDQGGDSYDDWDWSAMLGQHTLTAIACTGDNGGGECFAPVEVRLTISP